MSIIRLKEANCRNCYKCIRECPVHAIAYRGGRAVIVEEDCLHCGRCAVVCPQDAKEIEPAIDQVSRLLEGPEPVYASLAPSFHAAFPGATLPMLGRALKLLGFAGVEETAIGATAVSQAFAALPEDHTWITTCCPAAVNLVEKYYPDLVPLLAPVVSPMAAHARMLHAALGEDIRVVFIGPCIAKKAEAGQDVDAVLTFEELARWLRQENIPVVGREDADTIPMRHTDSRFYPLPGGVLRTLPHDLHHHRHTLAVDGMSRCMELLDALRDGQMRGYFIEMNVCAGGCIGGPVMRMMGISPYTGGASVRSAVREGAGDRSPASEDLEVDLTASFRDLSHPRPIPTEEELWEVLRQTGKHEEKDLLNCGACGYSGCREKAIAIFQGRAEPEMCMPYLQKNTEKMLREDIVAREKSLAAMESMRQETLDTAQAVIDKQMRVAQEIASLLGETTGETKAALLKLKRNLTSGGSR